MFYPDVWSSGESKGIVLTDPGQASGVHTTGSCCRIAETEELFVIA
jgi:hypothetical protein